MRSLTFQIGSKFEAEKPKERWFRSSLDEMRTACRPVPAAPVRLNRNCNFKDRIAVVAGGSYAL
jgi:hypothetical protein